MIGGAPTVNPDGVGTKASPWYRLDVRPGETAELRLRLRKLPKVAKPRAANDAAPSAATPATAEGGKGGNGKAAAEDVEPIDPLGPSFESTMKRRESEADDFYEALRREGGTDDEQRILRQAFAGMLWSKQYYGYNVARWLDGDPGLPPPPPERQHGRNANWRHFDAADILSMPDPWEYPWFAAWDLAFHAVTFAHIDPAFAKYQLLLLCREWFQHPDGALPAYEWSFDDVNPPVHAAAAYLVFAIDGRKDFEFLRRIFHKLLINFTWWLNREDMEGNDLFSGGFLGLDNIGAFDRSHLPAGTELEQSDATAWMFQYCLNMLRIATVLSEDDPAYEDFQTTFMEHAVRIAAAMTRSGLWDETDGFFYDALKLADGTAVPIKVHSMVGLIPLLPVASIPERMVRRGQALGKRFASFMEALHVSGETLREGGYVTGRPGHQNLQLSVVPPVRLGKLLGEMLSEDGFLSAHGLRALSKRHLEQPFTLELGGPHGGGRLRARRVDIGAVRWQLELARSGLDADQLPGHRLALELGFVHGRRLPGRIPDRLRGRRSACVTWPRTSPAGWCPSGSTTRTAAGPCSGRTRSSRPTPTGTTCSGSTSTSTATPVPASGPLTRPAGPGSWPTCSARAGSSTPSRAAARRPGWGWSRPDAHGSAAKAPAAKGTSARTPKA